MSEPEIVVAEPPEYPDNLPVLPLRDTVVFPDTMIPLTIGQERSIKLIDEVLAADRLLVAGRHQGRRGRGARPRPALPGRHRGAGPQDGQAARQHDAHPRAGPAAGARRPVHGRGAVPAGAHRAARGGRRGEQGARRAARQPAVASSPRSSGWCRTCPRSSRWRPPTSRSPAPSRSSSPARCASRRRTSRRCSKRATSSSACASSSAILARELEVLELGSKIQSDVRSEIDKSQREYFLRQQLQGHPAGAGRDQRAGGRGQRAAPEDRRARAARGGPTRRPSASSTGSRQVQSAERRVPRHPHVPRLDRDAALEHLQRRTTSTSRTRARSSTATTTTSRRSRTASSSTWPCASSRATCTARSCASSARPASARPASGARSPRPWAASSSASASAACATRPRSAGIAARTWGRCPASSCAPCATPAPTTRCS